MQSATPSLQRHSLVPLYVQVADALLAQINAGLLKPKDKLPSELELIRLYQTSRVTIRLAVRHLIAQGVVASRQGKGTFVLEPVIKVTQQNAALVEEAAAAAESLQDQAAALAGVVSTFKLGSEVQSATLINRPVAPRQAQMKTLSGRIKTNAAIKAPAAIRQRPTPVL